MAVAAQLQELPSRQLNDQDHAPLRLSLPAQASLGVIEDFANGRAALDREGDLKMRRCRRLGLLVIRLDQSGPHRARNRAPIAYAARGNDGSHGGRNSTAGGS
eukprot:2394637-Pyramimonas_sp.AAC.1